MAAMGSLEEDSQAVGDSPVVGSLAAVDNPVVGSQAEVDIHSLVVVGSLAAVVDNLGTAGIHRAEASALAGVPPSSKIQAAAWHSKAAQRFVFAPVARNSSQLQVAREDLLAFPLAPLRLAPN